MELEFHCAMCGKEKSVETRPVNGLIDARKAIESVDWIVQQNGKHFDIYCSKECAA